MLVSVEYRPRLKKTMIITIFVCLQLVFLSCNSEIVAPKFSNPTIYGTINLPNSELPVPSSYYAHVLGMGNRTVMVDSSGYFEIRGLTANEEYSLMILPNEPNSSNRNITDYSYGTKIDHIVPLSGDGTDLGVINLQQTGYIRGIVVLADTEVESFDKIRITLQGTPFSTVLDDSGEFLFEDIPNGVYELRIFYEDRLFYSNEIIVKIGETLDVGSLPVDSNHAWITGTVEVDGWRNKAGITVSIEGTDYTTSTDNNGNFQLYAPQKEYAENSIKISSPSIETLFYANKFELSETKSLGLILLQQVAVPKIAGTTEIVGQTDYSGIRVSIKGLPEFATETNVEGFFQFENVPLGSYVLQYQKSNTMFIEAPMEVIAKDSITMDLVSLTPNSCSLFGTVVLNSVSDYKGIHVTLSCIETGLSISTTTNSGGVFRLYNVEPENNYQLIVGKEGWDEYPPVQIPSDMLSLFADINITSTSIKLKDSIKPVVNSMTINNGDAATTKNRVFITLDPTELGSGITKMMISEDQNFSNSDWQEYSQFSWFDLSYGTETKTLYVKLMDAAGNESSIQSASIKLEQVSKNIFGILTEDQLNWTRDNNPYHITGDVIVPEGMTLTINPGVDLYFDGPYNLNISGDLQALGSAAEPITISGNGKLKSTTPLQTILNDDHSLTYISGNQLKYVNGSFYSITANILVENSNISSRFLRDDYGVSNLAFIESIITGTISRANLYSTRSTFNSTSLSLSDVYLSDTKIISTSANATCSVSDPNDDSYCENLFFSDWKSISGFEKMFQSTFENCLSITFKARAWFNIGARDGVLDVDSCEFEGSDTITFQYVTTDEASRIGFKITNNNFNDSIIKVDSIYKSWFPTIDISTNYFGTNTTQEMYTIGARQNVTNIYDYFDDITLPELLYHPSPLYPLVDIGCNLE